MFNSFPIPKPDGGSNIKNVQRGLASFSTQNGTALISEVNLAKSIVKITYTVSSGTQTGQCLILAKFNSPIELAFETGVNSSNVKSVNWEVVEYQNIKPIQSGQVVMSTGGPGYVSLTVPISAVNPSKCELFVTMKTTETQTGANLMPYRAELTNETTITLNAYRNVINTFQWYLVEFP